MQVKKNESLKKYTTLKLGGIGKNFYIPESIDDLVAITKKIKDYYIIANGSNLLINDKKIYENVIYMNKMNRTLSFNNGIIEAGASIKIQELINFSNKNNYGGIEYLYSVPATIGGAIYMNAGRGKNYNKSISDYIIDITIYDGQIVRVIEKKDCDFSYRSSIFKSNNWVILSARFKFDFMTIEESTKLKNERKEYAKNIQDSGKPNAGTVFRESNMKIMNLIKKLNFGWKNGMAYSNKTSNWIINNGKGTYKQAKFLINICIFVHKLFLKNIKQEYIEWK